MRKSEFIKLSISHINNNRIDDYIKLCSKVRYKHYPIKHFTILEIKSFISNNHTIDKINNVWNFLRGNKFN